MKQQIVLIIFFTFLSSILSGAPKQKEKSEESLKWGIAVEPAMDWDLSETNFVAKLRADALLQKSRNNMLQIVIAIHNYHDTNGTYPTNIFDKNGKAILSWRVQLLPYIEQDNVFRAFKLDEPWDSPNNKPLSETTIKVYDNPRLKTNKHNYTVYQQFAGPGTLCPTKAEKLTFNDIKDGTSNTLALIESSQAVPWAKPDDIPWDGKSDLPNIGKPYGKKLLLATADGSIRTVNWSQLSKEQKKAMLTRDGGEKFGFE
ncbi:MAG: DUF1559 domain-containing protein [Zavarzinella sp.]